MTIWERWLKQPQKIWLRRALFQVHLWSGVILGLYILMMSVTGSVVVYANELYRAATPAPIVSNSTAPLLTDDQLSAAAMRAYPGYHVNQLSRSRNPDEAVGVTLRRGGNEFKKRLFDPRTGEDRGEAIPLSIIVVSRLVDLHDNLLGGSTGRTVNGVGAFALLLLAATGLVVWWPGTKTWKRSLSLHRGVGFRRYIWHLHSMLGIWGFACLILFAVSGVYLCFPGPFQDLVDRLEPPTLANAGRRLGDQVIYWLAFLHFGRIQGIGIPCKGPGVCDQATKATWAFFGLAPAAMFVTGAMMWWNRVVRRRIAALSPGPRPDRDDVPPKMQSTAPSSIR